MHRHGDVSYCLGSYCNRASDSFCLRLLDTCPESLLCYCASLCFSFFISSFFLNHSFSVVSAGSWYRSSACNHVSLIMFIDFNIKIIKPLAPYSGSRVFA